MPTRATRRGRSGCPSCPAESASIRRHAHACQVRPLGSAGLGTVLVAGTRTVNAGSGNAPGAWTWVTAVAAAESEQGKTGNCNTQSRKHATYGRSMLTQTQRALADLSPRESRSQTRSPGPSRRASVWRRGEEGVFRQELTPSNGLCTQSPSVAFPRHRAESPHCADMG